MQYTSEYGDIVYEPDRLIDINGESINRPYFINVICDESAACTKFQVVVPCEIGERNVLNNYYCTTPLNTGEIELIFWGKFIDFQVNDKVFLLRHHLLNYLQSSGKFDTFLSWIQYSFSVFEEAKQNKVISKNVLQANKKILLDWVEQIKIEVTNADILENGYLKQPVKSVAKSDKQKGINVFTGTNISPEQEKKETEVAIKMTPTTKIIAGYINDIDNNQGWKYAFKNEADYNTFLDLLTCYFEHRAHNLPKEGILLKRNCKTKLAPAFNHIYKELGFKDSLKKDTEFFKIIKILEPFSKMTDKGIYKAITR